VDAADRRPFSIANGHEQAQGNGLFDILPLELVIKRLIDLIPTAPAGIDSWFLKGAPRSSAGGTGGSWR
jgi:hypothetical protein